MFTLASAWFTVTFTLLSAVRPPASRAVTVKMYVPAAVKVAVVFFEALLPLAPNVTATGPFTLHVYVSAASPPSSSAPSTERLVVVPAVGLDEAAAFVAIDGGFGLANTWMFGVGGA